MTSLTKKRPYLLEFKGSEEEFAKITVAAASQGTPLAAYLRIAALERAERDLAKEAVKNNPEGAVAQMLPADTTETYHVSSTTHRRDFDSDPFRITRSR